MKRLMLLAIVVLSVTACRGGTAVTSTTAAPVLFEPTGVELAGIAFEVHQEPG